MNIVNFLTAVMIGIFISIVYLKETASKQREIDNLKLKNCLLERASSWEEE